MKTKELRHLSPDALKAKADELRVQIRGRLFQYGQQKEKDVNMRRKMRHELARVLTILSEHEKTNHSHVS